MKKLDIESYIPFEHENFLLIENVIKIAQNQTNDGLESALTSILIYMNAVDYLSTHVLKNLSIINYLLVQHELNGSIYLSIQDHKDKPLGSIIFELEKYEFPGKKEFIEDLRSFLILRNKYAHNLLKLTEENIKKVDHEIKELIEIAKRILNTYDRIVKGMVIIWNNYKLSLLATNTTSSAKEESNFNDNIQ
jgi:hypothetical protein